MAKAKDVRIRQVTLARKGSKSDLLVLRVVPDPATKAIRTLKVTKGNWPGSRMPLIRVKRDKKGEWPGSRMVLDPTTIAVPSIKVTKGDWAGSRKLSVPATTAIRAIKVTKGNWPGPRIL